MKKYSILLFVLYFSTVQSLIAQVNVVPLPRHISVKTGNFIINSETRILFTEAAFTRENAVYLKSLLDKPTGFDLRLENWEPFTQTNCIILCEITAEDDTLGDEGYTLECVNPGGIIIKAKTGAGLFYGIQTLRQLLPAEIENNTPQPNYKWSVPCLTIADKPAFGWRGLLLDCCRHFMDKDFVKRYIDLLAYYKMNRLHWHLTEDQGWRIEIKKYPKLTAIGAWRSEADGSVYGGYYTQQDIKEVVSYAGSRHVTIIPEIEMPGHSVAALAAYPSLGCTGGPFNVESNWGVFKDVYCAGNDSTFIFLQNVLDEIVTLFPAKYIHIGGDEVPKYRWDNCDKCKARMKEVNAQNSAELQSYFIRRIEDYLKTKNRSIIGWDEILEGGVAPDATVQSWRGIEGAIEAADSGHDAIVSPTSHAYFDYSVKTTPIEKVYEFDPVPKELNADTRKHILGGECNIWTEWAPQELVDSKVFPRILAMSEVLWTYPVTRDISDFLSRVQTAYTRLDKLGVSYGYERQPVLFKTDWNAQQQTFQVTLAGGQQGLELHYTTDGTDPLIGSTIYSNPFSLAKTGEVKVRVVKNGMLQNDIYSASMVIHKGIAKTITYEKLYSNKYDGGGNTGLLDGIRGSTDFHDGHWQGFQKDDMSVTIDLGSLTKIDKITVGCLQSVPSWIFFPKSFELSISDDGKNFKTISTLSNTEPEKENQTRTKDFTFSDLKQTEAQYIKIKATNIQLCPNWHDAAGGEAWIFIDEIIIE